MTEQPNWDKINEEKRDAILKAQCINLAFQNIGAQIDTKEIQQRISNAREMYYELKKERIDKW